MKPGAIALGRKKTPADKTASVRPCQSAAKRFEMDSPFDAKGTDCHLLRVHEGAFCSARRGFSIETTWRFPI
jgi:hypothetical protein